MFCAGCSAFVLDAALFATAGTASLLSTKLFDRLSFYSGTAVCDGIELITQFTPSEEAVHLSRALDLAFDADTGG